MWVPILALPEEVTHFPVCKVVTMMSTWEGRMGVGDGGRTELGRSRPRCTSQPWLADPALPPLWPVPSLVAGLHLQDADEGLGSG